MIGAGAVSMCYFLQGLFLGQSLRGKVVLLTSPFPSHPSSTQTMTHYQYRFLAHQQVLAPGRNDCSHSYSTIWRQWKLFVIYIVFREQGCYTHTCCLCLASYVLFIFYRSNVSRSIFAHFLNIFQMIHNLVHFFIRGKRAWLSLSGENRLSLLWPACGDSSVFLLLEILLSGSIFLQGSQGIIRHNIELGLGGG